MDYNAQYQAYLNTAETALARRRTGALTNAPACVRRRVQPVRRRSVCAPALPGRV
ncbi:MAG: hypothetical protein ACLR7U_02915 [Ruthenibacterium lactatiformans]